MTNSILFYFQCFGGRTVVRGHHLTTDVVLKTSHVGWEKVIVITILIVQVGLLLKSEPHFYSKYNPSFNLREFSLSLK